MDRSDNFHGAHCLLSPHGPLHGQMHLHDGQEQSCRSKPIRDGGGGGMIASRRRKAKERYIELGSIGRKIRLSTFGLLLLFCQLIKIQLH